MDIYELKENEDVIDALTRMIEKDSEKKIFTIRVVGDELEEKNEIEVVIVFEDKEILWGFITIEEVNGKMACRIRGNYL